MARRASRWARPLSSMELARIIDPTARLGVPIRPLQGWVASTRVMPPLQMGEAVYVGPFVVVGEGSQLGERVILDAYTSVGRGVQIGEDTLVVYRATIGGSARIGRECVIGNTISENCVVGDRCRVFGRVIHKHEDSTISWDHHEIPEPSVTIRDDSFIGFDAIVAGGITIGPRAYVCAGSIVTRDVPPFHIARSCNEIVHHSEWTGPLKDNPLFIDT
jgi:UDP-3-O-[3-hydroxymyristoyl] glucosamine N-acyltransferase